MKSQKTLPIVPHFTKGRKAESLMEWNRFEALIKDREGQLHFHLDAIEAPASWSQHAVEIAASRYFRKWSPSKSETSIRGLVNRVTDFLRRAAVEGGYFASKKDLDTFIQEIKYILWTQRASFNSPVWFNAGIWDHYKIKSNGECYAWNPKLKKVQRYHNAYEKPQLSACFIQSLEDSIEGIFELAKTEARLFKYGSGTGSNFSVLRSRYEEIHSGGKSSGLISFLEVLDRGAGAIKSGGTTRRAAKMVIVDIDHPEVEDFIQWKKREEEKAKVLIKAGYSSDFEGAAYKTVAGQNANNSVRLTDKFLAAVAEDKPWILRSRTTRKEVSQVPARRLWAEMAEAAWVCADPGLQFHDTINAWHTCPATATIHASNPCSEYMFLDDSACNLASLNLTTYFSEGGDFLVDDFVHAARLIFIAQEIFVGAASYPTAKIAQNSSDYRPLGLGFANLGALLMRKGLGYDSAEGRAWAGTLAALMTGTAYKTSAELARIKGPFAGWKKNKTPMAKVMKKHQSHLKNIAWDLLKNPELKGLTEETWKSVCASAAKEGFRNAQATVIAPTGTIGLVMDCDTTGIEPDFSLIKRKKLAGGGEMEIINRALEPALRHLRYSEGDRAIILEHIFRKNSFKDAPKLKPEHHAVFATASGDISLSPEAHLEMMAAVQPFISGAISKTVNVPSSATVKQIEGLHHKAWTLGLKSMAVYRDGSKGGQPLTSSRSDQTNEFMKCPECHSATELHSGCYRCTNCGFTVGCA